MKLTRTEAGCNAVCRREDENVQHQRALQLCRRQTRYVILLHFVAVLARDFVEVLHRFLESTQNE